MPANVKRHAVDGVNADRWRMLGLQLRARRIELGYPVRKAFAKAKGLTTDRGAPNVRMINAMENNERPGTYAPGRLEQFARAYEVTADSVYDLLNGKRDQLEPSAPPPAEPRTLPPAPENAVREDAVRPYAGPIWDAAWRLALNGNADPSGAQLAAEVAQDPGVRPQFRMTPEDIRAWDASRGAMSMSDRAWLTGDLRRLREERRAAQHPGANSA